MDERKYNPEGHHRRSIRLPGTDYSQSGAYFVTLCTQNRVFLFWDIRNGNMEWNDAGQRVQQCWVEISYHFINIELDEWMVMPNHFHGIVLITDDCGRGTACRAPTIWQCNYYEHIIRNDES